ncbi:TlpA disulfide reductase family protein [Pirellulales bacterium]|nr:TlpA disulfide reductase family protein [Pirellulales bacterium]
MDSKSVVVETRLEKKTIDRRTLSRIIWLADGPALSEDSPAATAEELQVQAVGSDGVRITFRPDRTAENVLHGASDVLGSCRTVLTEIDQLLIGQRIHEVAAQSAFQQWRLSDAPQPRFMTEEPGEAGPPSENELAGQPAPEFELDLLDGTRFRLKESRGKIVVLDFWATWCGPCMQAMPRIAEVVDEFADQDVQWIAVNLQESKARIESSLDRLDLDVTVALDEDGIVAHRYQVTGIPQTVVIDREGNVAKLFIGGGPRFEKQLREAIEALVAGDGS